MSDQRKSLSTKEKQELKDRTNRITADMKRYVKERVDIAENLKQDPKKQERLANHKCPLHFYAPLITTQDIRTRACELCRKEISGRSVGGDRFCQECAKRHNLCVVCGCDVDLKERRK